MMQSSVTTTSHSSVDIPNSSQSLGAIHLHPLSLHRHPSLLSSGAVSSTSAAVHNLFGTHLQRQVDDQLCFTRSAKRRNVNKQLENSVGNDNNSSNNNKTKTNSHNDFTSASRRLSEEKTGLLDFALCSGSGGLECLHNDNQLLSGSSSTIADYPTSGDSDEAHMSGRVFSDMLSVHEVVGNLTDEFSASISRSGMEFDLSGASYREHGGDNEEGVYDAAVLEKQSLIEEQSIMESDNRLLSFFCGLKGLAAVRKGYNEQEGSGNKNCYADEDQHNFCGSDGSDDGGNDGKDMIKGELETGDDGFGCNQILTGRRRKNLPRHSTYNSLQTRQGSFNDTDVYYGVQKNTNDAATQNGIYNDTTTIKIEADNTTATSSGVLDVNLSGASRLSSLGASTSPHSTFSITSPSSFFPFLQNPQKGEISTPAQASDHRQTMGAKTDQSYEMGTSGGTAGHRQKRIIGLSAATPTDNHTRLDPHRLLASGGQLQSLSSDPTTPNANYFFSSPHNDNFQSAGPFSELHFQRHSHIGGNHTEHPQTEDGITHTPHDFKASSASSLSSTNTPTHNPYHHNLQASSTHTSSTPLESNTNHMPSDTHIPADRHFSLTDYEHILNSTLQNDLFSHHQMNTGGNDNAVNCFPGFQSCVGLSMDNQSLNTYLPAGILRTVCRDAEPLAPSSSIGSQHLSSENSHPPHQHHLYRDSMLNLNSDANCTTNSTNLHMESLNHAHNPRQPTLHSHSPFHQLPQPTSNDSFRPAFDSLNPHHHHHLNNITIDNANDPNQRHHTHPHIRASASNTTQYTQNNSVYATNPYNHFSVPSNVSNSSLEMSDFSTVPPDTINAMLNTVASRRNAFENFKNHHDEIVMDEDTASPGSVFGCPSAESEAVGSMCGVGGVNGDNNSAAGINNYHKHSNPHFFGRNRGSRRNKCMSKIDQLLPAVSDDGIEGDDGVWYKRPDVDEAILGELCDITFLHETERYSKLIVDFQEGISFPLGEGGRELLRACLNAKGCKGRQLQGASVPMLLQLARDWGLWNIAVRIKVERATGELSPNHEAFVRFKAMQSQLRKHLKREQMMAERDDSGKITHIRFEEMKYLTLGKDGREKLRAQLRRMHDKDPQKMDELLQRNDFKYSELRNATVPQLLKMAHICGMWNEVVDACRKQEQKKDEKAVRRDSDSVGDQNGVVHGSPLSCTGIRHTVSSGMQPNCNTYHPMSFHDRVDESFLEPELSMIKQQTASPNSTPHVRALSGHNGSGMANGRIATQSNRAAYGMHTAASDTYQNNLWHSASTPCSSVSSAILPNTNNSSITAVQQARMQSPTHHMVSEHNRNMNRGGGEDFLPTDDRNENGLLPGFLCGGGGSNHRTSLLHDTSSSSSPFHETLKSSGASLQQPRDYLLETLSLSQQPQQRYTSPSQHHGHASDSSSTPFPLHGDPQNPDVLAAAMTVASLNPSLTNKNNSTSSNLSYLTNGGVGAGGASSSSSICGSASFSTSEFFHHIGLNLTDLHSDFRFI